MRERERLGTRAEIVRKRVFVCLRARRHAYRRVAGGGGGDDRVFDFCCHVCASVLHTYFCCDGVLRYFRLRRARRGREGLFSVCVCVSPRPTLPPLLPTCERRSAIHVAPPPSPTHSVIRYHQLSSWLGCTHTHTVSQLTTLWKLKSDMTGNRCAVLCCVAILSASPRSAPLSLFALCPRVVCCLVTARSLTASRAGSFNTAAATYPHSPPPPSPLVAASVRPLARASSPPRRSLVSTTCMCVCFYSRQLLLRFLVVVVVDDDRA